MIVVLCLYKYFPYRGLQRDFMHIAKTIASCSGLYASQARGTLGGI